MKIKIKEQKLTNQFKFDFKFCEICKILKSQLLTPSNDLIGIAFGF